MCDTGDNRNCNIKGTKTVSITEAVGMALAHDITEIRANEFKGRAFKKGHIIKQEDICHLRRLGKERLFVLNISDNEIHEDEAAYLLAGALAGEGAAVGGEPKEGRINLVAERDGLLKVDKVLLSQFNMLDDVMCATLHDNSVVKKGQIIAGTRAIPLVIGRKAIEDALMTAKGNGAVGGKNGIIEVKKMKAPKVGIVITGNEVYHGRIKDAFAPVITKKIEEFKGEITGVYYAPDDEKLIRDRLEELLDAGANLLIITGGMSVDPDDVTRLAISRLGAFDITYGFPVLPGSMFLIAYVKKASRIQEVKGAVGETGHSLEPSNPRTLKPFSYIPILGMPACGIYHKTTVLDLVLPRVLADEKLGRQEVAELGHGGLCLICKECRYPVCPFGK